MGIKSSGGSDGTNSAINRHIGSAYDDVRIVADNIDIIKDIVASMDYLNNYLGIYDTPPTSKPDGTALEDGDYYLQRNTKVMSYWDADNAIWIDFIVDPTYIEDLVQQAEEARDLAETYRDQAEVSKDDAASSAADAQTSEDAAELAERNAKASEVAADGSETNAASSEANASSSQSNAALSASNANSSANSAAGSAAASEQSSQASLNYSNISAGHSNNSLTSANNSQSSANKAAISETNASASAEQSANSATASREFRDKAEDWANHQKDSLVPGETEYSAKHYSLVSEDEADRAKRYAESIQTAPVYQGVWDASTGVFPPNPDPLMVGNAYYIISVNGNIGGIDWFLQDQMIWNKTTLSWDRIPAASVVRSVNSMTGDVILNSDDIPFDPLNTNLISTDVKGALQELDERAESTIVHVVTGDFVIPISSLEDYGFTVLHLNTTAPFVITIPDYDAPSGAVIEAFPLNTNIGIGHITTTGSALITAGDIYIPPDGRGYVRLVTEAQGARSKTWLPSSGRFVGTTYSSSHTATTDYKDIQSYGVATAQDAITKLITDKLEISDLLDEVKKIDGSGSGIDADTVDGSQLSNLVQTTKDQTIQGTKTFTSTITGSISGNAETVTKGVYLEGDQTIGDDKTFSEPVTSSKVATANSHLIRLDQVNALDGQNVKITGDQSVAGVKTHASDIKIADEKMVRSASNINAGMRFNSAGNIILSGDAAIMYFRPVGTADSTNQMTLEPNGGLGVNNVFAQSSQSTSNNALTRKDYVDGLDGQNVKLTGSQSIAGDKTFTYDLTHGISKYSRYLHAKGVSRLGAHGTTGALHFNASDGTDSHWFYLYPGGHMSGATYITASDAPTSDSHLTRKDYVDSLDAQNVKLSGSQVISGTKTFQDTTLFGADSPSAAQMRLTASGNTNYVQARAANTGTKGNIYFCQFNTTSGALDSIRFYADTVTAYGDLALSKAPTSGNHATRMDYIVNNYVPFNGDSTINGDLTADAFIGDGSQLINLPVVNPTAGLGIAVTSGGQVSVDITNAPATTVINNNDELLVQNGSTVRRITRENLLEGVSGGIQLRGSVNPKSSDPTPITTMTVQGDVGNTTISQGTAPNGALPNGYTYIIMLDEGDKSTGVQIQFGGITGSATDFTVLDQDQLTWVGDQWLHLEVGDAILDVFGRTGRITAEAGDYTANQIALNPTGGVSASNVQGAIAELDIETVKLEGSQTINGTKTISSNLYHTGSNIYLHGSASQYIRRDRSGINHGFYLSDSGLGIYDWETGRQAIDYNIGTGITSIRNPTSNTSQGSGTGSLTRKDYVDGLNGTNVKLTGNQTVAGNKVFTGLGRFTNGVGVDINNYVTFNATNTGLGWGVQERSSSGSLEFATRTGGGSWDLKAKFDTAGELYLVDANFKVWHSGNVGIGSGLNADLLDGLHSSAFASSSHVHPISQVTGLQTALNAKLNSSSYTASDILAKIKTVDGSGSGLDADKLDGLSSGSFIRSDTGDNVSGRTRWTNSTSIKTPAGTTAQRTTSPEVGEFRYNTTSKNFEGYTSRGWAPIAGDSEDIFRAETKGLYPVGTDTINIAYDVGFVDIHINGYKLANTEYTATNGTSVVLKQPLISKSYIDVRAWNRSAANQMDAQLVQYDNTSSGLVAQNAQNAIDEVWQGKPNDNLLINGDFSVWQRGNSFSGYEYSVDRWLCTSATVNKTSWKAQGTCLTANRAVANAALIAQPVELLLTDANATVKPFVENGQVTVSVTVSTTNRIKPHIIYRDAGAGNPSNATDAVFEYKGSGTTGVQTLSWTFSIDHLPIDSMRCLVLTWWGETASTDVIFINSKMELGSVATPFVPDLPQVNLAKCQRYFYFISNIHHYTSSNGSAMHYFFPVWMRIDPHVTPTIGTLNRKSQAWCTVTGMVDGDQFLTADAEL